MAPYLGDFAEDATVDFIWSSNDSNGASITRSTDGTISVYKDNGVTQSVAGVTDTENFDGVTGIHACTIDTSADAFYTSGSNYSVVLTGAVIDTQSVDVPLAHFSIQNRSALRPTTTGRTLDITADGEAGIDLNNASGTLAAAQIASDTVTKLRSLVSGTADSGSTTTLVDSGRTEADTDYWKGCWLLVTSGTAANQVRLITSFSAAGDQLTFAPALTQAISTNTYEILPAGAVDLRQWLGQVPLALVGSRVSVDVGSFQTNTITSAVTATGCIDASALSADAVDKIRDAILADSTPFLGASIAAILADTADMQPKLGTPAGASLAADLADVPTVAEFNARTILAANYALEASVQGLQNNTRTTVSLSGWMERPNSGNTQVKIVLNNYDSVGSMEAPDSAPTVAVANEAGTDRSGNLQHPTTHVPQTTMVNLSEGRYQIEYELDSADVAPEQLIFTFTIIEGGVTRTVDRATQVADTEGDVFTTGDRAKLDTLHDTRLTAARATNLDNLDAAVASRATPAEVNTEVDNALNTAIPGSPTAGSINKLVKDNLDAAVSSRSTLDSAAAQAACDAALVAIHLDHLLAVDTPTLPGVAGSILADLLEDDGGTWRFIANALEQAPGGGGSDPDVLKSGAIAASPAPTATTLSSTVLSEATTDFWINKVVHITSGNANGLTARISAFDPGQDQITFTPALVVTPAATDTFDILRRHAEAPGAGATDFTGTEQNVILKAARKLVNKKRHTVATGVNEFLDDAGTSVIQTETPTESGGVVTVTPS